MTRVRRPHASPPWLVVLVLGGLVAAAGLWWMRSDTGVPARPLQPSVLLVTLDTTRADRLGSYGYAAASTPNLDRLAAGGVRFAQALSPVPLTLPAHASLLSGQNPYRHGVRNNGHFVLAPDVPTLAERFSAAGYDTAAFVSSFVLDRQFGLARGFGHYDDALDPPRGVAGSLEVERRGDRTVAAASAWLTARGAAPVRPYFVWVHLYDAHDPYTPPPPFADRFADRPYDGEIAFQDALVGDLLATAGQLSQAPPVVVVAADHGESLGEHGESTHGLFVYESALRVPLILSWPGVVAPRVVEPPVGLIDVAPTLVELAGLPAFVDLEGRSLVPVLEDEGASPRAGTVVYAETLFPQFFMAWSPLRSVRDGAWKLIDAPEPELYDLARDPAELTNLYAAEPATARALRRTLAALSRDGADRATEAPMSAEARRRLAALGYVSVPTAPTASGAVGPDPKRMVPLFERLLEANRALSRGAPERAAGIARDVLAEDAGNSFAHLVLGRALLASDQHVAAIDALQAYLARVPGSADAHHWIALAHLRAGDRTRALAEEDAALALDPRHGAAIALRAGLLFSSGREQEGLDALRAAVAESPTNPSLRVDLADLLTDAGLAAEAEPEYRRALLARPGDPRARLGLGLLLAASGRLEDALAEFSGVLGVDAAHDEARLERAVVLERLGRVADARADYERLRASAARPDIRQDAARRLVRPR